MNEGLTVIQEDLPKWPDLGRPDALDEWLAFIESAEPKSVLLWPADYAKELARWIRELEQRNGGEKKVFIFDAPYRSPPP